MTIMKQTIFVLLLLFVGGAQHMQAQRPAYLDASQPIEKRVESALSLMTLDEKIRIIHAQSKFSAAGVPRLGIPDLWTSDGPHGVRANTLWDKWGQAGQTNDSCVAFPALTCLAATFSTDMALRYGTVLGEEALYRSKDMILGPGVNINRTPLNGRNFEYMGEDPFLAARLCVPYIQGVQANGVSACVKHFALNNDEEYRTKVNVTVSDRALREIYLPAFEAAVKEAGVWGVMGAYNLYDGQYCCHNEVLLNRILKQEWGFDGVVVSDWGGCRNTTQAARNGLDMEFGSYTDGLAKGKANAYDYYYLALPYKRALLEGKLDMKELDDKVRRVLRLHFRTTMNPHRSHGYLCSEDHYEAACTIGEEGVVLLQNKGSLLPMRNYKNRRVLVVGENAVKMMTVGGGSSSLKVQREVSPLDGLRRLMAQLCPDVTVDYECGYVSGTDSSQDGISSGDKEAESRSAEQLMADAVAKAKGADYVIFVGGLNKSDYQDCEGHDRKALELPYGQDAVVAALVKANPNVVFVNLSGAAVAMPWRNSVKAVVQAWYLGSEAGTVIARILTGEANPSGKLPFTWMERLDDYGSHALGTYPGTWYDTPPFYDERLGRNVTVGYKKLIHEDYKEGIYVGYRWADKHGIRPAFAFGHGLSYTSFRLSDLRVSQPVMPANGQLTFTVNVKNTGKRAGAEVVQLYIHDDEASVDRPYKELKAFAKVWLQPGEDRDVTLTIDRRALSFWGESQHDWVLEPGTFTALVGTAADNLPLKASFKVAE